MKLNHTLQSIFCAALAFPTFSSAFEARVTAVGTDSVTIKSGVSKGLKVTNLDSNGKATRVAAQNIDTFAIKPTTVISVDGLPSKLSDIRRGMKVLITQGGDKSVASMISANTVPPPMPKADPKEKKPRKLNRGVGADQVLIITPERITFGQIGADKARAYFITPTTVITVNGKTSTVEAVKVGMEVRVNAKDGTTAGAIVAQDKTD